MASTYTVEFENVSISAANDLWEFEPQGGRPVEVIGWCISQSSETRDVEESIIRYRWMRGLGTGGSGGSSATARPLDAADGAASFLCEYNNSTIATAGTAVNLGSFNWNCRFPDQVWLPRGCGYLTAALGDNLLVCRLLAAPPTVSMAMTVWVREHA